MDEMRLVVLFIVFDLFGLEIPVLVIVFEIRNLVAFVILLIVYLLKSIFIVKISRSPAHRSGNSLTIGLLGLKAILKASLSESKFMSCLGLIQLFN